MCRAMRISPTCHRAQGREAEAERALRDGLAAMPDSAPLHHALGLSLARSRRVGEGVTELGRAGRAQSRRRALRLCLRGGAPLGGKRGRRCASSNGPWRDIPAIVIRSWRSRPSTGTPAIARPPATTRRRLAAAHPDDPGRTSLAVPRVATTPWRVDERESHLPSRRNAADGWTGPRPAVFVLWACSRRSPSRGATHAPPFPRLALPVLLALAARRGAGRLRAGALDDLAVPVAIRISKRWPGSGRAFTHGTPAARARRTGVQLRDQRRTAPTSSPAPVRSACCTAEVSSAVRDGKLYGLSERGGTVVASLFDRGAKPLLKVAAQDAAGMGYTAELTRGQ